MRNTVADKKCFGLISGVEAAKGRITNLEDTSRETSQLTRQKRMEKSEIVFKNYSTIKTLGQKYSGNAPRKIM